jgi:hypothetical protein
MKVSVWVGKTPSWDVLDKCLTFRFTEDGDAIPCPFGEAFDINWFDEDLREATVAPVATSSLQELLCRSSKGMELAVKLTRIGWKPDSGLYNAAVVLYDFNYSGSVARAEIGDVYLQFAGVCEIQM